MNKAQIYLPSETENTRRKLELGSSKAANKQSLEASEHSFFNRKMQKQLITNQNRNIWKSNNFLDYS